MHACFELIEYLYQEVELSRLKAMHGLVEVPENGT